MFSRTCAATVAPEATYQAWFAHYLISQFGIDRVAREPDFGYHSFTSPLVERFTGHQVMLDAVVTRQPGILPTPLAYVCVLDNHPTRTYNRDWLLTRLADDPVDDRVQLLFATNHAVPQTTE